MQLCLLVNSSHMTLEMYHDPGSQLSRRNFRSSVSHREVPCLADIWLVAPLRYNGTLTAVHGSAVENSLLLTINFFIAL